MLGSPKALRFEHKRRIRLFYGGDCHELSPLSPSTRIRLRRPLSRPRQRHRRCRWMPRCCELFHRGKSGAAWFYWIAVLSLINTVVVLSDGGIMFALGLTVTMITDTIAASIALKPGGNMTILVAALCSMPSCSGCSCSAAACRSVACCRSMPGHGALFARRLAVAACWEATRGHRHSRLCPVEHGERVSAYRQLNRSGATDADGRAPAQGV